MRPQLRIVVFGANGQVGEALTRTLADDELIAVDRSRADLRDTSAVKAVLSRHSPQVIVNAAAYTAVDKAEADRDTAFAINAIAPGLMAEWAAHSGALLVHYGTDYVFDGSGAHPRDESAPTAPLSVYGASKLAGEERISASGCRHVVLRTSWLPSSTASITPCRGVRPRGSDLPVLPSRKPERSARRSEYHRRRSARLRPPSTRRQLGAP
jgi:dTDP-4-dehydrorhamnose reductase